MEYVTGKTIKTLREKNNLTQKQLADMICISDKAVSKWETDRGMPDVSLLEGLARALNVSIAELLSGDVALNKNKSANIKRSKFYVCPICSNVIHAMGEGAFSCCGIRLLPLEPEAITDSDDDHCLKIEEIENELFVTMRNDHPMEKKHYISFIACIGDAGVQIEKLYPEQTVEARFRKSPGRKLYAFCNKHGLFEMQP
ncbi:MAG: helix-turn-helix domain-containing protein [Treponema sp.]|nr:helix-turn-helix domain-containing protein [Candidatus Treponema equi]